eukprot:TRINITY_DN3489_c6_g1_i1.p1 TRINITY_DN3489_c6_g1~~TRINITY_DN3489_c6_g1_i1.p1  ORF type:complete len:639 (+),score=103.56 TRINITY_DN3489_c6_g1_i1:34-1950(+)
MAPSRLSSPRPPSPMARAGEVGLKIVDDVMLIVLRMLKRHEVATCSMVCGRWRRLIHGDIDLVVDLYAGNSSGKGWESLGTPAQPIPEPLLNWLSVSDLLQKPLPIQRAIVSPMVMGIDAVLQCQPQAGVTTSAIIAALWKATSSRLPQHLVVYCSNDILHSAVNSVKKIVDNIPAADPGTKINIMRRPKDRLGLKFNDGTLVLKSVNARRVAHNYGAGKFVGKRLTHVNGNAVSTLAQVSRIVANKTALRLRFEGRGIAEGIWWEEHQCGGNVQGVPFTISVSPVDNLKPAQPPPGIASLTLRFSDVRKNKRSSSWCVCFFGERGWRKPFQRQNKKRDSEQDELLNKTPNNEVSEVTVRRSPTERLGIKFLDGTLVLKSVNPTLKAHRHGVSKFTGRRLTHVNGIEVKTLEEVRNVIKHKTTFVTVESTEGLKAEHKSVLKSTHEQVERPVTVLSTPHAENASSVGLNGSPIRAQMCSAAEHFCVLGCENDIGKMTDKIDDLMCEILIPSILIVCNDEHTTEVADALGGHVIDGKPPSEFEHILVVSPRNIGFAPRVSFVVVTTPTSPSIAPLVVTRAGGVGETPGASLSFFAISSADAVRAVYSSLKISPTTIKETDLVPVLRPLLEPPRVPKRCS